MSDNGPSTRRGVQWIMLAVLVWGLILAIGVGIYGVHPRTGEVTIAPSLLRGGVVLGCVVVFLGFWQMLLWSRK